MAKVCACSNTLANTGSPSCDPVARVTRKLIIVNMFQDDGTENEIDLSTATLNEAFFTALRDQVNGDQRWYPLAPLDNVENTAEDSVYESLNSGRNLKVQNGARSFMGVMVEASAAYLGQLEDIGCGTIGAYIVDLSGNLVGNGGSTAGKLKPIKIDSNTWDATIIPATDTTVQKVQLKFEWDRKEQDSNLRMILKVDMANADLIGLNGLFDVLGKDLALTSTTNISAILFSKFGTLIGDVYSAKVEGLTAAQITVRNTTTSSDIVPSAVVESPNGTYTITMAAQTSADIMKLKVIKSGFSAEFVTTIGGVELGFTIP